MYDPTEDLLTMKKHCRALGESLAPASYVDVWEVEHLALDARNAAQRIIDWARNKRDESNV